MRRERREGRADLEQALIRRVGVEAVHEMVEASVGQQVLHVARAVRGVDEQRGQLEREQRLGEVDGQAHEQRHALRLGQGHLAAVILRVGMGMGVGVVGVGRWWRG